VAHHEFPQPQLAAPLSVWAQFACGVLFVFGLFARWAGLVCAFNFIVALVMVDAEQGLRAAFPASMLVLVGLYIAARGAGAFSLDRLFTGSSAREGGSGR
jgi:putative oxidoreductase